MTKEQSKTEMRYRLGKYVLQVLLDAELITTEEAINIAYNCSYHFSYLQRKCGCKNFLTLQPHYTGLFY